MSKYINKKNADSIQMYIGIAQPHRLETCFSQEFNKKEEIKDMHSKKVGEFNSK
jgi:hypothetical protein